MRVVSAWFPMVQCEPGPVTGVSGDCRVSLGLSSGPAIREWTRDMRSSETGDKLQVICDDNNLVCAVSYNVWAEIVVLSVKLFGTEDNSDPEQDEKWAVTWTILICNTSVRINSLLPPVRHSLSLCVNRQPILHSLGLPILGLCCEPFLWPWHILCQCLQCQYNPKQCSERERERSKTEPEQPKSGCLRILHLWCFLQVPPIKLDCKLWRNYAYWTFFWNLHCFIWNKCIPI